MNKFVFALVAIVAVFAVFTSADEGGDEDSKYLTILTGENFDQLTSTGHWFIKLYVLRFCVLSAALPQSRAPSPLVIIYEPVVLL